MNTEEKRQALLRLQSTEQDQRRHLIADMSTRQTKLRWRAGTWSRRMMQLSRVTEKRMRLEAEVAVAGSG